MIDHHDLQPRVNQRVHLATFAVGDHGDLGVWIQPGEFKKKGRLEDVIAKRAKTQQCNTLHGTDVSLAYYSALRFSRSRWSLEPQVARGRLCKRLGAISVAAGSRRGDCPHESRRADGDRSQQ